LLIDAIYPFYPHSQEIRKKALISAGFPFAKHCQRVISLSGGERSRLLFVGLSLAKYHLLMLDEPTNHLDISGKEDLIIALNKFEGGLLLVTHDRVLIEKSCNRFWYISDGQLKEMDSINNVYQAFIEENVVTMLASNVISNVHEQVISNSQPQDILLERLCELDDLLSSDLLRKKKFQKIDKQVQWQAEITSINSQLGFN
jgi:ABC-type multidrug transport system ATPase subunit